MSNAAASSASRDSHLALRRVERQQQLIERLHAAGEPITLRALSEHFGVSGRTIARDVERLQISGVPIEATPGRGGGVRLARALRPAPIPFDLPEIAALMSSLAALGPSATESAASAMHKLVTALEPR